LTDAAQNHGRRFCFTLIARNVGQCVAIRVKFVGQHRHFGLVPATIYVARQAGKTIVGTFNVQATAIAFFPVLGCGQMVLNLDFNSRRFTGSKPRAWPLFAPLAQISMAECNGAPMGL
jgi:hypothetical protein